jgi:hypothetical protein
LTNYLTLGFDLDFDVESFYGFDYSASVSSPDISPEYASTSPASIS